MSNQTKRSEGVGSAGEGPRFVEPPCSLHEADGCLVCGPLRGTKRRSAMAVQGFAPDGSPLPVSIAPVDGPRFVVCETCDGVGHDEVGDCIDCGHGDCAPGVRDTRPTPVEPSAPVSPVEVSEAEVDAAYSAIIDSEASELLHGLEPPAVRAALRAAYAERAKREGEGTSAWPTSGIAWAQRRRGQPLALVRFRENGEFKALMPNKYIGGGARHAVEYDPWRFWPVSRPSAPGVKP